MNTNIKPRDKCLAVKRTRFGKTLQMFCFYPPARPPSFSPLTSHIKCCTSEIWTDRVHFQDKCYDEVIVNENPLFWKFWQKNLWGLFLLSDLSSVGTPNFKQSPAGAPHSSMTVMRLWCCDLPGFSAFLNVENYLCVLNTLSNL